MTIVATPAARTWIAHLTKVNRPANAAAAIAYVTGIVNKTILAEGPVVIAAAQEVLDMNPTDQAAWVAALGL